MPDDLSTSIDQFSRELHRKTLEQIRRAARCPNNTFLFSDSQHDPKTCELCSPVDPNAYQHPVHDPATCPDCQNEEAKKAEKEARWARERLTRELKIRRLCLRARVLGLFLMGVSFLVLPWWSMFTLGVGTLALLAGVRSDLRVIEQCNLELGQLSLPPARLVRGSD